MSGDSARTFTSGGYQVWYQPQVDLRTGKLCGAEALVRRAGADGKPVPPACFIPQLEKNGRIAELDESVLETVCAHLREASRAGIAAGPVSVNLSRVHLGRPDAARRLLDIAQSGGASGADIVFELTESAAACDEKELLSALTQPLRCAGFSMSLDDFGIGYSSLKLLADASFDVLKLDRHFVSQIGDARAEAVMLFSVDLAHRLGMTAVAEGVETRRQMTFLREAGCDAAQGFLFHRPVPWPDYRAIAAREAEAAP